MRPFFLLLTMAGGLAAQTASVEGTVVDQTSGKPLERVHVALLLSTGPESVDATFGAITDAAGHFTMGKMQPGRYRVVLERTGYLQAAEIPPVSLKEGQQIDDLKFKLARAAILTGRVVDQNGDPVPHVQVQAMPLPPAKLAMTAREGLNALTDERGEFHFVAAPARYYLQAAPQRWGLETGPPEVRSDGTSEMVYGVTFYPASPTKDRASPIEVTAGNDVDGLEIRLAVPAASKPLSISGTVTGMPAGESTIVFVALVFPGQQGMVQPPAMTEAGPDGKYSVSGLLPGTYEATARTMSNSKELMGRARVTLDAGDVTNLDLALTEPLEVQGTVEAEGGTLTGIAGKSTVRLFAANPFSFFGSNDAGGHVSADGSFQLARVAPGTYHLWIQPLPPTAYVKSMEYNGAAADDGVVEVAGGSAPHIKITVGLDGATISGKVSDKDDAPPTGYVSVFLMADPKKNANSNIQFEDGKYRIEGIRPGKYRVLAVDNAQLFGDLDAAQREETLAKLYGTAEEIEVKPGDRLVKDLKLPAKEVPDAGKQ